MTMVRTCKLKGQCLMTKTLKLGCIKANRNNNNLICLPVQNRIIEASSNVSPKSYFKLVDRPCTKDEKKLVKLLKLLM